MAHLPDGLTRRSRSGDNLPTASTRASDSVGQDPAPGWFGVSNKRRSAARPRFRAASDSVVRRALVAQEHATGRRRRGPRQIKAHGRRTVPEQASASAGQGRNDHELEAIDQVGSQQRLRHGDAAVDADVTSRASLEAFDVLRERRVDHD